MTNLKARFKTTSAVSSRSRLVDYEAGQIIFREGDLGTEMFVIRDGRVEILGEVKEPDAEGGKSVAVLEKGDFFGEMAVLEGRPRTASVRALTDVKLVRIDGTTFTQLLRSEPEIAVRIMRKLSRRLREAEERSAAPSSHDEPTAVSDYDDAETTPALPKLVHGESGVSFDLPSNDPILVGRRDPITGIEPHVDLSGVDPDRSCSRQHGKIVREGSSYLLVEDIGTTNGTFLNDERLATGVPQEIRNGDELRFGTVTLVFKS